jgi:hypothetical protein
MQLLLQGMKPLVRALPALRPHIAAVWALSLSLSLSLSRREAAGREPKRPPSHASMLQLPRESGGRCSARRRAQLDICASRVMVRCERQVRRLVCGCVGELLRKGDTFSIFARLNQLVGFLESSASLTAPAAARLGALECVAVLATAHGRHAAKPLADTVDACRRHWKGGKGQPINSGVRAAALRTMAAVLIGTQGALPPAVRIGSFPSLAQKGRGAAAVPEVLEQRTPHWPLAVGHGYVETGRHFHPTSRFQLLTWLLTSMPMRGV